MFPDADLCNEYEVVKKTLHSVNVLAGDKGKLIEIYC